MVPDLRHKQLITAEDRRMWHWHTVGGRFHFEDKNFKKQRKDSRWGNGKSRCSEV
jgi:hypothetical protein